MLIKMILLYSELLFLGIFLREMNLPSTRTSFAELFINDNFMGVYVVTEHIDEEFIKKITKKIMVIYTSVFGLHHYII